MRLGNPAGHGRPSRQWPLIRFATAVVFILGSVGFARYAHDNELHTSFLSAPYHALQLFILHTPHLEGHINWTLELARWGALLVAFWATVLGFISLFKRDIHHLMLPRRSGHIVICGLGRRGLDLVRLFVERGDCVVAIEEGAQNDAIQEAEALGATVVVGNGTDPLTLQRARAKEASRVVAICGEDGTNVEIAVQLRDLLRQKPRKSDTPLRCHVHLTDVALRHSLQQTDLLRTDDPRCRIRPFDLYEANVRALLQEMHLDGDGIRAGDPRTAQLVILGLGRMGEVLALKAVQLAHFANHSRLKISIVDRTAEVKRDRLLFRYPALAELCDIETRSADIESPGARDYLLEQCRRPKTITSVAICFDDDCRSIDLIQRLRSILRDVGAALAVRLSSSSGLAALLDSTAASGVSGARLHVFGTVKDRGAEVVFGDRERDRMAAAAHADYVRLRTTPTRTPQTDRALQPWDDLDDAIYKDSNRQQADHLPIKLRAVGCAAVPKTDPRDATEFTQPEVELLAEMEHARWVAERRLAGWTLDAQRPKDDKRKTSPYLVAWRQVNDAARQIGVSDDVQQYDRDAVLAIPRILALVDQKLVRTGSQGP